MDKQFADMTLEELYLSWVNEFITISAFAEHYGLTREKASTLVDIGREAHNKKVANKFKDKAKH